MSFSHDTSKITVSGTETGDALRAYITSNSLGTVTGRTTVMSRSIDVGGATLTDNDCTWIFPSTYHWDFSSTATAFSIVDGVIIYTDEAKGHSTQPRATTLTLTNVQYRIEDGTGRTDFFSGQDSGFVFTNVQFISYGGSNVLHLATIGGLLENVSVKVGSGAVTFQPDCNPGQELILRNLNLAGIGMIVGNGGGDLTAVTRLESLSWTATVWIIGSASRGQYYKVINPVKPSGWLRYEAIKDATNQMDEFHTHNVKVVDENNAAIEGYRVILKRSDNTTLVYDLTTDASGDIAEQEVLTYEQIATNTFTQHSNFLLSGIAYNHNIISGTKALQDGRIDETVLSGTDVLVTQTTKSTVDAYTAIDTPQKFYDRAMADLVDNYAGEDDTTVTRIGTQIDLKTLNLTVNADGATVFSLTGSALTIKASNYTGGFSNGTISHGSGNPIFTDLVLENATWNADQATWTGSADATTTIDVASTGTYDVTGFTFDAASTLNNSSGGAVNIIISAGQQQPTVTGGGTTTFLNAGATVTFNNLTSANVQIIEGDTITVNQRSLAQTGTLVFNTPNGSSGTWCYVINRAGYDPIIGTFTADGADVTVNATQSQKQLSDGAAMYQGTTSAFLSVVPSTDGSRMFLRISDGSVSAQACFDETEDALMTQDGMTYLCNGGGQVDIALLATGQFVTLRANVRIIRDTAPDANATIAAFVQSTDGTVLDATNGAVQFVTPNSDVNIISVNGTDTTSIADFRATGFATPTNVTDAQTAIIAQVDANEAKIDLIETKAQADARQALLIAEHDATQAALITTGQIRTELATELGRIDVAVSSRNATAPDNAGITAIKAKTDNLPTDPADQSLLEAAISSIPSAPSAASIADQVRVELATELARIDVATSTMATPAQVASELATYDAPTKAELDAVEAKVDTAIAQATLARKHLTNRDKIDDTAKTLTRYDDDGTTPLVTFDLKDKNGVAASTAIFEKVPQ